MAKKLDGEIAELRLSVPKTLKGYLCLLAQSSVMGASANDIATFLLTKEVQRLADENHHAKSLPQAEAGEAG